MRKRTLVLTLILTASLLAAGCGGGSSEEVKLGGIDTTEMLQGLLDRTARTLATVYDIHSAEAAVAPLRAINDDYDDLLYHVPKLSPKGRQELAKKAQGAMPSLSQAVSRINQIEQLAEILGPQMNPMLEKLAQLAVAPEG
jgi:hypothetical protein